MGNLTRPRPHRPRPLGKCNEANDLTWPRPRRENSRPRPLNFDLGLTSKILDLSEASDLTGLDLAEEAPGLGLSISASASPLEPQTLARLASASPLKHVTSDLNGLYLAEKVPGLGLMISASASHLEPQTSVRGRGRGLRSQKMASKRPRPPITDARSPTYCWVHRPELGKAEEEEQHPEGSPASGRVAQ
ncbi:hypothetical protein Fcan01_27415 [Folsomia candida]|uniref:Uncharacterized protein n=1 Tax=Folsomia candida TaxID=158441 RepID=A0A226CZD9_FOLCA|nr:hypothetical protein Fcan01_27415 [Folsomia candida]